MDKFFVCLANSYKRGGRCVAGVEVSCGENGRFRIVCNDDGSPRWIRPVADTQYGEIPTSSANNILILSLVKLTNVKPCPSTPHTENVRFSTMECCKPPIQPIVDTLRRFVDNKHRSLFSTKGKAISSKLLAGVNYSLMLIHPENAEAYIDENREKSKNRMRFTYLGEDYDLPVTDPFFLEQFKQQPEIFSSIDDVYIVLSLGLEYEGWHHKLVATVIIPEGDAENENYIQQQKKLYKNAYSKWTKPEDKRLEMLYRKGLSVQELMEEFDRNEGAILARISKLKLDEDDDRNNMIVRWKRMESPDWFEEYEAELSRLLDIRTKIDNQINDLRSIILSKMEQHRLESIRTGRFLVSYTPAKTVKQFDKKAFETDYEDLYETYCKPKQKSAFIVVKRIED